MKIPNTLNKNILDNIFRKIFNKEYVEYEEIENIGWRFNYFEKLKVIKTYQTLIEKTKGQNNIKSKYEMFDNIVPKILKIIQDEQRIEKLNNINNDKISKNI